MQVNEILQLVVNRGGSDLHLTVPSKPVVRVDGLLITQDDLPPLTAKDIESVLEQTTTEEQMAAFRSEHELDFAYGVPGLARFRVNALQQRGTISLAFRLVPFNIPSIDELGLPSICKQIVMKPRGLVLITGAAGSGKSTTLAAMINHLNETEKRNIITIEDPIEFLFRSKKCLIRQRDIGDDTKSFSTALRHVLRHDPDVIVIGEIRDLTTISTAIRASETGHLVLATLHSNDAAQTIDRIIDMFPPGQQQQIRLQLGQVTEAVLSQVLLPRIGGGRIAAFEIMLGINLIRTKIREGKVDEITSIIGMCKKEGMQTLDQALVDYVRKGLVAEEEAILKSSNPEKLQQSLQSYSKVLVPNCENMHYIIHT
jgi:twitching motility protein PilT